jgi:LPS-assembly protein
MLIKNKKINFFIFLIGFFLLNQSLYAEEFNISADEVNIDQENEILVGTGSVKAIDSEGKVITANKIIYKKKDEFLLAEGEVVIQDLEGNSIKTNKASYDKLNELITTYENTELILSDGYNLLGKNIVYETKRKLLSSDKKAVFKDNDGNSISTEMFQYNLNDNLFSSVGVIKIIDVNKNKYFFKELYVDTKNKEMVGSDVSVALDPYNFGLSENNDPRFVANDILISKNKSTLSKGVFTTCKKRGKKCPPWSLKARKIEHDKVKKTIHYQHATLKVYDIPIFYFPRFFHPDPTVKRQSGFLSPLFTNSSLVGKGFSLPYFWAINESKDFTFSPKIYSGDNALYLNEYRQAFKNGFLTLDTSYSEGYKNISPKKRGGSRNHLFANLDLDFSINEFYESNFSMQVQTTNNNTYFRAHDINTSLVDSDSTDLENIVNYNFNNDDTNFNISANIFENLRVNKDSDKYEYILPKIEYSKKTYTNKLGLVTYNSDFLYSKYETNKQKTFLTNNILWNPLNHISRNGFVNSIEGIIRNMNYKAEKTEDFKNNETVNELNAALSHKTSFPLKKDGINYTKLFSPSFMLRYAPGHMRNLSNKDVSLNYTNLYSLNKTAAIDVGLSSVLGFDYKINKKVREDLEEEKFSISLGQILNYKKNNDMPSKSSLDQRMSDVVGEVNYNFSEIGNIDYKFSLDHNLNDLNYNEISTKLNFGMVEFNLDYLEQQNHIGTEHYASSGITLNLDNNSTLGFSTKKNFKTDSTELYDLSYQYAVDCLTAGLVYRREFYRDIDDVEPNNTLMFTLTFVPFGGVTGPIVEK